MWRSDKSSSFGALCLELWTLSSEHHPCHVRSCTSSYLLPYPLNTFIKITISPEKTIMPMIEVKVPTATFILYQVPVNANRLSVTPSIDALKNFSPLAVDIEPKCENMFGLAPKSQNRVWTRFQWIRMRI